MVPRLDCITPIRSVVPHQLLFPIYQWERNGFIGLKILLSNFQSQLSKIPFSGTGADCICHCLETAVSWLVRKQFESGQRMNPGVIPKIHIFPILNLPPQSFCKQVSSMKKAEPGGPGLRRSASTWGLKKRGMRKINSFHEFRPISLGVHKKSPTLTGKHSFIESSVVAETHTPLFLSHRQIIPSYPADAFIIRIPFPPKVTRERVQFIAETFRKKKARHCVGRNALHNWFDKRLLSTHRDQNWNPTLYFPHGFVN